MRYIVATAFTILLAGCAGEGVEVNLPGVGNIMSSKKADPELAPRGELLVPPNVAAVQAEKLPAPGKRAAPAPDAANWPVDQDVRTRKLAQAKCEAQKEYEKHGKWKQRPGGIDGIREFEKLNDGLARRPGLLDIAKGETGDCK
jgi:hypothetical protein